MPLVEVVGNAGGVLFWQSGPIGVNAGVICGLIVIGNVAMMAHCPADGVKVYVVVPGVAVLIVAGLQVPVMPLVEVVGSAGAVLFWQSGPIAVNAGVICGSIVMINVACIAHCPADGVKVYVVVVAIAVLIVAGLHVPVIPLVEVVGSAGAVEFWQSGPIAVNAGVICGLMVIGNVAMMAHCPADGVKV